MTDLPKGRAMRASVAQAIHVEDIAGVRRVTPDPLDDRIVYVACTSGAWTVIQHKAALYSGVEHTGILHKERQAQIWPADTVAHAPRPVFYTRVRCVQRAVTRSQYVVQILVDDHGRAGYTSATTTDQLQALRWERWMLLHQEMWRHALRSVNTLALDPVVGQMFLETMLAPRRTHEQWMQANPLPQANDS